MGGPVREVADPGEIDNQCKMQIEKCKIKKVITKHQETRYKQYSITNYQ